MRIQIWCPPLPCKIIWSWCGAQLTTKTFVWTQVALPERSTEFQRLTNYRRCLCIVVCFSQNCSTMGWISNNQITCWTASCSNLIKDKTIFLQRLQAKVVESENWMKLLLGIWVMKTWTEFLKIKFTCPFGVTPTKKESGLPSTLVSSICILQYPSGEKILSPAEY